jgi:hypothetical protein
MTAQSKPYPRVELLISMFADWLTHRRELSEIRQMDRTDFDRIASDLRISPGEWTRWSIEGRTPPMSCRSC